MLQTLLNRTIADDARVIPGEGHSEIIGLVGVVGTNLDNLLKTTPVKLRSRSKKHRCWLRIEMQLFMDDKYLTVHKSMFGISAGKDDEPIFHYDYERDKDAYTEAHLQVLARHDQLDPMIKELCVNRKKKHMGELHFPVGGRRFRPALEDVIEFLIDEMLVDDKPGWKDVLEESRQAFRTIQLKAAVRRDPYAAAEILRGMDWEVKEPGPSLLQRLKPRTKGKQRTFPMR